ncbi:MAG TPA: alpha/beta hydrolase [Bryobacteraceae bacterium]|jgi:pimeloyl-ACP methyl ester carboxylesterase|nr:alpha/beta hydrolase [Bryobacteraceae bacterium]
MPPRCLLVVCLLSSALWSQPARIAGEWDGTIVGKLRVIVRVDRAPDNSLHGTFESVDQGHAKLDIDQLSFDGKNSFQFELKKAGASYSAELNSDGTQLTGAWQQGGAMVPLTLRRSDAPPVKALQPVVRGRVSLNPCGSNDGQGLCGTFEVYENRATQLGRKIPLHILILPAFAEKPAPDPVFGFAGGPGQSAAETFPLVTAMVSLRQTHDLVFIDQRGTGKSNPLPCPVDDADAQMFLNGSGASTVKDLPACRKELETTADLAQYTTSYSADDVDDVREALGYDKIDLLGGSYGTLAALVYARRHGQHVRAMVLEGVAPPDYKLPLPFAKTIQASLGHLFDDCAADPDCHQAFPNLKAEFEAVVKRLDAQPATFQLDSGPNKGQTVTLSRGAFVSALRPLLYQPAIVRQLPSIIHKAFENNLNPFATVAILMRRAVNQSIARGMAYSVGCSESIPFISEADIERETAGTYLGDFDVRLYQRNCSVWPHANVGKEFLEPVRSDVPALLITGAEDPATPPSLAAHAAEGLSRSRIVVIPHGTHLTASPCIDKIIVQFINQGSASGIDKNCVNEIRHLPFVTKSP